MAKKPHLPDSAAWFSVLTNHLPMVFYILDRDGVFLMSEGLGLKKLGLKPGQVVGQSVFDVYRNNPDIVEAIKKALSGTYVVFEHAVDNYYVENHLVPQFDESGMLSGLICAAIDIDERIKAEQTLHKERMLSQAIMDSVPGILYLYDDTGHLLHWNKNHEVMTGYSADELGRMTLQDWYRGNEEDLAFVLEKVQYALQGHVTSAEANLLMKNGERVPMHLTAAGLTIEGKPHITGIGIDISELKRAQTQLLETNRNLETTVAERTRELTDAVRELKASNEKMATMQRYMIQTEKMAALGNLVAGVAHEINTPIGIGITASSHLLDITEAFKKKRNNATLTQEALDAYLSDLQEAADIVLKNLNRAGKLVRSFKQVSADQTGEPTRTFEIRSYVEEILTSLSPALKRNNATIHFTCPEGLRIYGQPGGFAQIITNLVMNSLTHAFHKTAKGHITMEITDEKKDIQLRYSDDGSGIEPEILPKIFDPFFTTNRGNGGTGLGLAVLFNIVTQSFGGSVDCESVPDNGTTFLVRLRKGEKA